MRLMEKPLDIPLLLETIRDYLAESETERVRRLTRPDFKTAFLDGRTQRVLLRRKPMKPANESVQHEFRLKPKSNLKQNL